MENRQLVAERIKLEAKRRGISVKHLLEECELGVNTVGKLAKGTDITSQNLAKIADYLEVSVDYLLGRGEPYDSRPEFPPKPKQWRGATSGATKGHRLSGAKIIKKAPVGDRDTIKERINQLSDSQIDRLEGYLSALEEEEEE